MTGDIRRRIANIQAALKKKSLEWGNDDDLALAQAIRDRLAGRSLGKLRQIVAATAHSDADAFQAMIDLAEASVEGPPDGYVPPDDEPTPSPPSTPDVQLPIIEPVAELLDEPIVKPTHDVAEYFDEMDEA